MKYKFFLSYVEKVLIVLQESQVEIVPFKDL